MKKTVWFLVVIFLILFLAGDSYAYYDAEIIPLTQIDIKNNIYTTNFGLDSHYVFTTGEEYLSNGRILITGRILDYPKYKPFIALYERNGELVRMQVLSSLDYPNFRVYEDEETGCILMLNIKESASSNRRFYLGFIAFDSDLNLLKDTELNQVVTTGLSIETAWIKKTGEGYDLICKYSESNLILYVSMDRHFSNITLNAISSSINDHLTTIKLGERFFVQSMRSGLGKTHFYELKREEKGALFSNDYWPFSDTESISNVVPLSSEQFLILGVEQYALYSNGESVKLLSKGRIKDGNLEERVLLNQGFARYTQYDSFIQHNRIEKAKLNKEGVLAGVVNDMLTTFDQKFLKINEVAVGKETIFYKIMNNEMVVYKDDDHYYVVTENGSIIRISNPLHLELSRIEGNTLIFSKFTGNTLNNFILIHELNTFPFVEVLNQPYTKVGNNGFILYGTVRDAEGDPVRISTRINQVYKEIEVDTKLENTWALYFDSEELLDWIYRDIVLKVEDMKVRREESLNLIHVPDCSPVYYQNIHYIKLQGNKLIERFPEDSDAYTAKRLPEQDTASYMNYVEYTELAQDILKRYDHSLFGYWLKDYYYVNKNGSVQRTSGSDGSVFNYIRKIEEAKYNTRFIYNESIKAYMEFKDLREKEMLLGLVLEVNKRVPSPPTVSFSKEIGDWINEEVVIRCLTEEEGCFVQFSLGKEEWRKYEAPVVLNTDGLWTIRFRTVNAYGSFSSIVEKVVKMDRTKPELLAIHINQSFVSKENIKWVNGEEVTYSILVREALSKIKNVVSGKAYRLKMVDTDLYSIEIEANIEETIQLILYDAAGNELEIHFKEKCKVDRTPPVFKTERVKNKSHSENKEVILEALDTESGLLGIFYSINGGIYKLYQGKLELEAGVYDRNAKLMYYAVDQVGNKTEEKNLVVNLNAKPSIRTEEIKKEYGIRENVIFYYKIDDPNPGDSLSVRLEVREGDWKVLEKIEHATSSTAQNEWLLPRKYFEEMDYDKQFRFRLVVSDGLSEAQSEEMVVQKVNTEPLVRLEKPTLFEAQLSDYQEFWFGVEDPDAVPYNYLNLKVYYKIGKEERILLNETVKNGEVRVQSGFYLEQGINKVYVDITDGYAKVKTSFDFFVEPEIRFEEERTIFIAEYKFDKSKEYFNMLHTKIKENTYLLLSIPESTKDAISRSNLGPMELIKPYEFNRENKIFYTIEALSTKEMDDFVKEVTREENKRVYALGDVLNIDQILFYDEEADYFERGEANRGLDRKIQVYQTPHLFENHQGVIEENGYLDEDLNWSETHYRRYEDFNQFDQASVERSYTSLGLKLNRVGRYILNMIERDYIEEAEEYSKYSNDLNYEFYVHRKPEAYIGYRENKDGTIDLILDAYDLDFYSHDKGIKQEGLYVRKMNYSNEVLEDWHLWDKPLKNIALNPTIITEYRYEVTDFGISLEENAFCFSNSLSIRFDDSGRPPRAGFKYRIASNKDRQDEAGGYLYKGNMAREKAHFEEEVSYNDLFARSGLRELEYLYDEPTFNALFDEGNKWSNTLTVKNRYGLSYTTEEKELVMREICLRDYSEDYYEEGKGFAASEKARFKIKLLDARDEDIEVVLNIFGKEMAMKKQNGFYEVEVVIPEEAKEEISYLVLVYSRRSNELIHKEEFRAKVYQRVLLYNFNILSVSDPLWTKLFYNKVYYTKELPLDSYKNHGNAIKKGYSFGFSLHSKGLRKPGDHIKITPTFYLLDESMTRREAVKLYYKSNDNQLIEIGSVRDTLTIQMDQKNLGGLTDIRLRDSKHGGGFEVWEGKYFVPYNAFAIQEGKMIRDGYLVVNFQLEAICDGVSKFTYVPLKWKEESEVKRTDYKMGDVVVYSNSKTILSDYEVKEIY